jgi:signal transduction histidine kinase
MASLVEDLLVLARLDADTAPRSPSGPVEVDEVVTAAVGRHTGGRVVVRAAGEGGLCVQGDHDELVRVLTNLLDNAVRHAHNRVEVGAERRGGRVALLVDDDGPGVPQEDRERVLQRFARLDEARDRDAGGSGLGLAIVRELVERRGGRVLLADSPLGGLRVEVLLRGPV